MNVIEIGQGAQRMHIEELGIYTVQDGKIIREEFLHQPQAVRGQ